MSESMKIVTYNIRCGWDWDGINSFVNRAGMLWKVVKEESPDVISFQEVTDKIHDLLVDLLPDYIVVGQGRDSDYRGEGLYTAFKKSTMDLIGLETFWIGEEPFTPCSKFEERKAYPRICVVTMLRHKATNKFMRLYNVHLDNLSGERRTKGVKCVFEQIKIAYEKTPMPFVILGDFNDTADSEAIKTCNNNGFMAVRDVAKDIPSTYHEYGKLPNTKIDYIFMTEDLASCVKDTYIWNYELNGIYLSDHYPVCAQLEIE